MTAFHVIVVVIDVFIVLARTLMVVDVVAGVALFDVAVVHEVVTNSRNSVVNGTFIYRFRIVAGYRLTEVYKRSFASF